MNDIRIKLPSPALVVALIALAFSMAGNAGAFSAHGHKIGRGEIAKGAVTASALAPGAVGPRALKKGAVTNRALAGGAVGPSDLASNAVTARAIAPSSVYGYALGPEATVTSPLKDIDSSADLSTWTNSGGASAACPQGARLMSGGVNVTNPGNRRVAIIRSAPVINGTNGWIGELTSDSGGSAEAKVEAVCLQAGP